MTIDRVRRLSGLYSWNQISFKTPFPECTLRAEGGKEGGKAGREGGRREGLGRREKEEEGRKKRGGERDEDRRRKGRG